MAPSPFTAQVKFYRIATFSRHFSSLKCSHSCNISLPRKPTRRNVHLLYANSSPFSCQFSVRRNLYSQRQTGISLIAFDAKNSESKGGDNHALDAVFKLYSIIFNKITPKKSEIPVDDCPFVCNFLSFLQGFQGQKEVCGFFSYLIRVFGNSIEIVVKQTLQDGLNIGVQWKFESEKMHVPVGKGFSFYISHSYKGKAMIRNCDTFLEPLLRVLPFRLKIVASLAGLRDRIGSFMVSESDNKTKGIRCIVLAVLAIVALLFFLRLFSFKIVFKL